MLQATYGSEFLLDIGWYPSFDLAGCFQIRAIKELDWGNPFYISNASSRKELIEKIKTAQNLITLHCAHKWRQ